MRLSLWKLYILPVFLFRRPELVLLPLGIITDRGKMYRDKQCSEERGMHELSPQWET